MREQSEADEQAMSRMVRLQTKAENDVVYQAKLEREGKEKEAALKDTVGLVMNLDEDQALAMDVQGRIIRPDAFKGHNHIISSPYHNIS